MLDEDLDRIARCLHPDPHTILGPHDVGGAAFVTVLRPNAQRVRVKLAGGGVIDTESLGEGLFSASLPALHRDYEIETTRSDGVVTSTRDAYSFAPTLGDLDLHLFAEGKHLALHHKLGAHVCEVDGVAGTRFAVWAPAALSVRVIGDFNDWQPELAAMRKLAAGVWEIFLPGIGAGALYKFQVMTRRGPVEKSDPFGRAMELRPNTASRVYQSSYTFRDRAWIDSRIERAAKPEKTNGGHVRRGLPITIYEVHLQSWKRRPLPPPVTREAGEGTEEAPTSRWLTYRELADELVDYVVEMGFTYIELLPILEHPYDGSWGYQVSGYFAPTARLGSPDDLRAFIDRCHERGVGVILDWVPAHFPRDSSALGRFDGTPLFEHWDPRRGEHRQWETFVFDWGRPEVKNFLIASALYWIEEFHIDGLRVDAVASMLYLDYGASHPGEWEPNQYGGRENLEAVAFLRALNDAVHEQFPGVILCAEESTAWPGVTRPTYTGGLGFDLKWNMGWMHDTLSYVACDPVFRAFHHTALTFGMMYAYSERFLLPLSHDEVVHLKRSLLEKVPGDPWQRRATLRSLFAYMWAHPGKKLLFMGGEIGQTTEWNFATELDWRLLEDEGHRGIQKVVKRINALYREHRAFWELDDDHRGFRWIDANDASQSVASFLRFPVSDLTSRPTGAFLVFVGNFTPVIRRGYRVGVPRNCDYLEVLNTDAAEYGGSNVGNLGRVQCEPVPSHGFEQSIVLTLPPLAVLYLIPADAGEATADELAEERKARAAKEAAEKAGEP
ncbi:MAG: 1,4-alpha-glucan branching protein GlgB [Polyangiaceae bacterium]|nr:1,4-alpha-glucan branching protein GlgB [Polyangiaceae bacterium]